MVDYERELALERAKTTALERELKNVRASAEKLAQTVEAEEEFLVRTLNEKLERVTNEKRELAETCAKNTVNDALERRLRTLQDEKVAMENALEREQECMMHRLTSALEELGRERQSALRERDRLSRDLERETTRLKQEKVRMENALESEEEHIVNVLQTQISALLTRIRGLERQVKALGGTVSDGEYMSDDSIVVSPRGRSGYTPFGSSRDVFAGRKGRPATSSNASPFASDGESMSPRRRSLQGVSAPASAASVNSLSEPPTPR